MSDQYRLDLPAVADPVQLAWERVQEAVKEKLNPQAYQRFIEPLRAVGFDGETFSVQAPGDFVATWVRDKYLPALTEMVSDQVGGFVRIQVISGPVTVRASKTSKSLPPSARQGASSEGPTLRINERFSFESFVVGQSNRMAFAGARAVAQEPGRLYNPLFIYGPSGVGKTHLLNAIAREVLRRDPNYPVAYITAQQFTEQFVTALQTNRLDAFRKLYRSVQLWLVDDVQMVAGRDKTQEEFFHIYNVLRENDRQIVLTAEKSPIELVAIEERLRTRFQGGLVADIQMPDTETRCAIILRKAEIDNVPISADVAMYLAEYVPGSIRVLEGAMTRLAVQSSIDGVAIDLDLAKNLVDRYYGPKFGAKPSVDQVIEAVSRHYRIPVHEIKGESRRAPIVHARHVAVYLTREITLGSWPHIGAQFGDRDHTTVIHAYRKIGERMATDREVAAEVQRLRDELCRSV